MSRSNLILKLQNGMTPRDHYQRTDDDELVVVICSKSKEEIGSFCRLRLDDRPLTVRIPPGHGFSSISSSKDPLHPAGREGSILSQCSWVREDFNQ